MNSRMSPMPFMEEFLLRRSKLSCDIAAMTEFQIRDLSLLLARDRLDLLRHVMICGISYLSPDELSCLELFASGFKYDDFGHPDLYADCHGYQRPCPRYLLSEFAVPEEENLDCLPPDIIDQIESGLTQFVHDAELCDLSDYPSPEASSSEQWHIEISEYPFDARNSRDRDSWWCRASMASETSRGFSMATQQEMKMKDFTIGQLTRQLGFERGRGEWLTTEQHWRERRERHVKCFSSRPGTAINSRRMQDVRTEVDRFMGEDHLVEESYRSNSSNFWLDEASSLDALFHDIEMQTAYLRSEMTEDEALEYEERLMAAFRHLKENFNARRSEAARHQSEEMQVLHKHHDKVRKRHLFTIAQIGQESSSDDSGDEDVPTRQITNGDDARQLGLSPPPASADQEVVWNVVMDEDGDGDDEDFSDSTTCVPFSDENSNIGSRAS